MIFNIGSEDITKREDAKAMLLHLEDEYRKANISEKNYAEMKRKYNRMLNKSKITDSKEAVIMTPKTDKKEKEDISLFLESLEGQFRRGEINKEEYDNIRDINLERLKDIDYVEISPDDVEKDDVGPEEVKLEVKEKEKKGIIQKLFGGLRKQKKEEGKVEVKVPEEMKEEEPEEFELEKNPESGELELKTWEITKEPELEINEREPQDVIGEPEEKVEEMPEETVENKEYEEPEEKPKKKGFLKSIFGKKKKEEPKPEERQEDVPEEVSEEKEETKEPEQGEQKKETKTEEAPKEETKPEEKKEERLEPGEIEEVTPEVIEKLAAQMAEDQGAEQIEEPEEASETSDEEGAKGPTVNSLNVEIEKLKVMLDAVRDTKRATDETIQNLSENLGEIRSLVMQTDANFKTSLSKMERMEDDVSAVRPKEITKKFNEVKENLEKKDLELEKIEQKLKGTTEKVNEIHEMLKSIGGVENLASLNKDIQDKLKDITEAIKYIQRIGTRTEKIFIDLSKGMEDLILLKAKQEDYDESLKNVLSSIDSLDIKLKEYVTKEDLNVFREENMMIKKEMDKINKVLPVAELKLPEEIVKLRKEREDIEMFLESLEAQFVSNSINKAEYEDVRRSNLKKLSDIEGKLEKEWKSIGGMLNEEKPETENVPEENKEVKKKRKAKKSVRRKRTKSESSRKKKILSDLKKIK